MKSTTTPKFRKPIIALTVSAALITGIFNHEGFRSQAYRPLPTDVLTIGAGTTVYPDGTRVKAGDTVTREQAVNYLKHDTQKFVREISKCIKVPLYQYEFEAYVSLTYNIGEGAFCKSTLVRKLNTFDYAGACQQILRWDKFQGRTLPGLTKRRVQEYNLCMNK